MRRIFTVARAEYGVAVKSKAFIIGVFMMPVFFLGGVGAKFLLQDQVDKTDRHCVVVDRSGFLFPLIENANQWRSENEVFRPDADGTTKQVRPLFHFEAYTGPQDDAAMHAELSARVESNEILGYAIIHPQILDTEGAVPDDQRLAYHTKTPSDLELPKWLEYVVDRETRRVRFENAGLDQSIVSRLGQNVRLVSLGLIQPGEDSAVAASRNSEIRTFAIPIASMILMFTLVMMTTPTLLNQVLEEKIQKISEVLISSISPFELLMGKLIGTVFVTLTLSAVYLLAIYGATLYFGVSHYIDPKVYPWFFLFLIIALFMYGSVFSAIGAACNEIKDAQSLMTPAMLVTVVPFFTFSIIVQSPNSAFATAISLFPPATPMIMMLRILLEPGPPLWELLLGLFLTIGFAVACVAAAGKIFRIGILSQGQSPTVMQLMRWIIRS